MTFLPRCRRFFAAFALSNCPAGLRVERYRQFVTNGGDGQRPAETMLVISARWNIDPQAKTMRFDGSLY
jgi:hypothetical protein